MIRSPKKRYKLLCDSLPNDILRVVGDTKFESMTPDEIFGFDYLGRELKWHQFSVVRRLAEHLECLPIYKEYDKKVYQYLSRRSIVQNNHRDSDIHLTVDKEWSAEIFRENFKNAPDIVRTLKSIVKAQGEECGEPFRIKIFDGDEGTKISCAYQIKNQ